MVAKAIIRESLPDAMAVNFDRPEYQNAGALWKALNESHGCETSADCAIALSNFLLWKKHPTETLDETVISFR